MVKAERIRIEKAYADLLVQIDERQAFEQNNLNFFDVKGYTLLQYAAALGDLAKVQECLARGADVNSISVKWMESPEEAPEESPIAMALKNGHVEIAEILYNRGANCVGVHPDICQDQKSREWLEGKIKQFFTHNPPSSLDLSERAAEIGDLDFIKHYISTLKKEDQQEALNALLVVAAQNGKSTVVDHLLENGANTNRSQTYAKNALNQAALHGHLDVVETLLASGADIARVDERKCTALMRAVDNGSPEIVSKLINAGVDLSAADVNGDTLLHHCARCNDPKVIKILAEIPGIQDLMAVKNIYAQSPMDIAISKKNDPFIQSLKPDQNLLEIQASPAYGREAPVIGHHEIVMRWQYYFNMHHRNKDLFAFEGKCNGFAYLHEYYAARGMEPYFFKTLALMSEWDGSQESLDKPFDDGVEQKQYYNNLGELFEQWINDVVYLQHSGLSEVVPQTRQDDREEHMLLIGNDDFRHVSLYLSPTLPAALKTPAQASEFLKYFSRMPVNTRFELRSTNHDTSGHVAERHELDYYDPNYSYQTSRMGNSDAMFMRVMDYQYIWTGSVRDKNDLIGFDIDIFCFSGELNALGLDKYRVFSEGEMPRSQEDARRFQEKSPNRFTPLHIAVMTHCTLDLEKMIKDGFCDLNAVDVYNRTPLQVAIENRFDQAILLIAAAMPEDQKAELLVRFANEKRTDLVVGMLENGVDIFKEYAVRGGSTTALCEVIRKHPEYCSVILSKMPDINHADQLGNPALFYAVEFKNLAFVKKLIEQGADVNAKNKEGISLVDLLETTYHFDHDLRAQAYVLILPGLTFETESEKHTLSELLFLAVEQQDKVLSEAFLKKCDQGVLNMPNKNGLNVLHMAIMHKDCAKVGMLLKTDININAQTHAGNTALMSILILGSSRVKEPLSKEDMHALVKACLALNPDLSLTNNKGESAASLIKELYPHDAQLDMMYQCQAKEPASEQNSHDNKVSAKPK
ncbi:MAG: ankyrin repeat domain-containing protein [Gammaproteobacteria bacterium]